MIYPWQQSAWQQLFIKQFERFPHALIIHAKPGIGSEQFALAIIERLLCIDAHDDGMACGQCKSCILHSELSNPDHKNLSLMEGKTQISVDQVREAIDWVFDSKHYGQKKILHIQDAKKLSLAASNSLLKTLEEPPEDRLFILSVEHLNQVLPTILSRCQIISLKAPSKEQAISWLQQQLVSIESNEKNPSLLSDDAKQFIEQQAQLADGQINWPLLLAISDGAPIKLLEMLGSSQFSLRADVIKGLIALINKNHNAIELAKELKAYELEQVVYWVYALLLDSIRLRIGLATEFLINQDFQSELAELIHQFNLSGLYAFYAELNEFYHLPASQLNQQLFLESLLIKWGRLNEQGVSDKNS